MSNAFKSAGNTLTKGNELGQTGQSFAGSQNPASLKGKLMSLEVMKLTTLGNHQGHPGRDELPQEGGADPQIGERHS